MVKETQDSEKLTCFYFSLKGTANNNNLKSKEN